MKFFKQPKCGCYKGRFNTCRQNSKLFNLSYSNGYKKVVYVLKIRCSRILNFNDRTFQLATSFWVYQYHKADWNLFANELRKDIIRIPNEMTERKLEKCLDKYYSSINKALEKACPKKKTQNKRQKQPMVVPILKKIQKANK